MTNSKPKPVYEVDTEFFQLAKKFHRIRWWTICAIIGVLIAIVGWLFMANVQAQAQIRLQQQEIMGSCDFYRTVGVLPIVPSPGQSKPAYSGVAIINGARTAYIREHCEGPLPPPSPQLRHWTTVYRIRLVG